MKQLEKLISDKRAEFYIKYSEEKNLIPFDVYMKNIEISQGFYGLMHFIEIILRNKISKHLIANWDNWIELDGDFAENILSPWLKSKLEIAHKILEKQNKEINSNTVISSLTFGFWTSLCDKRYTRIIWKNKTMKHIFPNMKKVDYGQISIDLDRIRTFRNRIFHYEQILTYDHEKIRKIIHEYLKYMINPKTGILEKVIIL